MAELYRTDGSTLFDNRRDVGQRQLEQAMNHWLLRVRVTDPAS
jgi:hypothetical protein